MTVGNIIIFIGIRTQEFLAFPTNFNGIKIFLYFQHGQARINLSYKKKDDKQFSYTHKKQQLFK